MSQLILTLNDTMRPERVGGKFSRQKTMFDQGLPIPKFFCLSDEFYKLATYPLTRKIQEILAGIHFTDNLEIKSAALEIQKLFENFKINPALEKAVFLEFDRQFSQDTLVSIRSSIVGKNPAESEDSSENPFAGISASFLYIRRSQIVEKLCLCWSSGFSAEALLYRFKQGLNLSEFSVAVGIQRMVFGQCSFVVFTCNPRTACRETLIVAGYGIGEGVVQERVGVDHYFVNQMTSNIRTELGNKTERLDFNHGAGSGLIERPVPLERSKQPCLSELQIRELVATGARIEKLFQAPQDIEGTFTENGSLFILQSRPIALDHRRSRVWTNANVTESFPGVTTPLTYSFSRFFYRTIFYDCYRMLGINQKQLHERHEALDRMIGFLSGRIYYCLTSFYQLHMQSPLFPIFRAHWEKMMGFLSSYEIQEPSLFGRVKERMKGGIQLFWALTMITYRFLTHERDMKRFHNWWERIIRSKRGKQFDDDDPLLLETDFLDLWRQVGSRWGITLLNDTYLPVIYGWTEKFFQKWGLKDPALLNDLLCGDDGVLSVEIVLSAVRLAERIRANPELRTFFDHHPPQAIWDRLVEGTAQGSHHGTTQGGTEDGTRAFFPEFSKAVHTHLHRFGDRGLQELKMEQPNLRSNPTALIQILQNYARQEMTVDSYLAMEQKLRHDANLTLNHALKGKPLKKFFLSMLLSRLRNLIRNRENSRYCRSELFGYSRQVFTALGKYFEKENVLGSWNDVFFLTQDEIFGYLDGTGVTNRLQGIVDLRREEFHEHLQIETSAQITTIGPVRNNSYLSFLNNELPTPLQEGDLRGLGSSSGKVRGYAHIVLDPNQPVNLGKEGILIARETDPGWLFLMLSSKGIVVERGSMLSHTAITGRKFGIPTVVSLPNATSRIPDGALIELDGASGIVKIIQEKSKVNRINLPSHPSVDLSDLPVNPPEGPSSGPKEANALVKI